MNKNKKISHSHFVYEKPPLISEEEIFSQLTEKKGSILFLGRYTLEEAIAVLKKRNLIRYAEERGLVPLIYDLDSKDYPTQRFRIFFRKKEPDFLLVDLKIREGKVQIKKSFSFFPFRKEYDFLIIEWLTLQNPLAKFTPEKPRLPGQIFPGLGLLKKAFDIFIYLARLMKKDGVLVYPWYFHNALIYSDYLYFFNPYKQGEVLAIKRNFPDMDLHKLAWMVYLGCLKYEKSKKNYEWFAEEQIFPLKKELKKYFESKNYNRIVNRVKKRLRFYADWDCFEKKFKSETDQY
ncbi:hypothetical protein NLC26_01540 [Candidatus Aminicenantes bacterium AC-708-M15]|jgi:hypothetical protein|nr:hypothetical protein [SCandidatus Aminicenantes bacterium Aminicenantia_JdfR_composite]MCP2597200.1 hypothetical protein [Candidatus Aminicenantes bacterium AC-335-G13]MCP2598389.1 hypothetical protein [Candidatus Aminicenantes bacterium AC-335-L06]MCP2604144.1 hypothetical protein [Candidatus Aminicenantes bacterium AC-708-M15]MCP2606260.1 hypothetical protein [Candidatus Aminicenantes bacterium AC-708-I09]MCP2617949.1 hypothetical protein [Candidatus Aminicenantes bacterium AC-335-A11]